MSYKVYLLIFTMILNGVLAQSVDELLESVAPGKRIQWSIHKRNDNTHVQFVSQDAELKTYTMMCVILKPNYEYKATAFRTSSQKVAKILSNVYFVSNIRKKDIVLLRSIVNRNAALSKLRQAANNKCQEYIFKLDEQLYSDIEEVFASVTSNRDGSYYTSYVKRHFEKKGVWNLGGYRNYYALQGNDLYFIEIKFNIYAELKHKATLSPETALYFKQSFEHAARTQKLYLNIKDDNKKFSIKWLDTALSNALETLVKWEKCE